MKEKLKLVFIFILISFNVDIVKANILNEAIFVVNKIFSSKEKTLLLSSNTKNNEDIESVLKVNYNNIYLNVNGGNGGTQLSKNKIQNNFDNVLVAEVGPMRTSTEDELIDSENIQVYEVKDGDTLSSIAKIYNVSNNTIAWANNIKNGKPKVGEILIILPISGVKHTVKNGDTVKSIANKYKADANDIYDFNNIKNSDKLTVGDYIIIPDGKINLDAPIVKKISAKRKVYASVGIGYYARPIIGGVKSQGLHGHNGIDIAAPNGTTLLAAASGNVVVARNDGYNGGYGKMVIINHPNGTQTVYGHMDQVYVSSGQNVKQGEVIGLSGNTGKSTGPHLHFEVRGAENPF